MSSFTSQDVQRLRRSTGVGMMDAKKALEATEGDFEKAVLHLREKGLADAAKRSGRAATDGTIGYYLHPSADYPTVGVMVEVASETDFVARSREFQDLAHQLALHIAARQPSWVTIDDVPPEDVEQERAVIRAQAEHEDRSADVIPEIVEGRLKAYYEDRVLYQQAFVNPNRFSGTVGEMVQQTAAQMGENIHVRRFVRLAVGETDG